MYVAVAKLQQIAFLFFEKIFMTGRRKSELLRCM